jgi:hypothetical protein
VFVSEASTALLVLTVRLILFCFFSFSCFRFLQIVSCFASFSPFSFLSFCSAHVAAFDVRHTYGDHGATHNFYTNTLNILLHLNYRPQTNDLVLNSRSGGTWGTEITLSYSMLLISPAYPIFVGRIYMTSANFLLYNSTGTTPMIVFPHRLSYALYNSYDTGTLLTNCTRTFPVYGCTSSPCQNGATCIEPLNGLGSTHTCSCVCLLFSPLLYFTSLS